MSGMDRLTDEALEQARRALDYYEDCANQLSKGGSGSEGAYDSLEYDGGKLARDVMAQIDAAARELLAHRRASQAAPAPSDYAISKEWAERMLPLDEGVTPSAGAPAPSDALREALEECDCCVDGLQADGETPCPYCTKPTIPVADAAEALLEAYKSGAWVIGRGRTLEQVAMIIAALRAALSTPTEERQ